LRLMVWPFGCRGGGPMSFVKQRRRGRLDRLPSRAMGRRGRSGQVDAARAAGSPVSGRLRAGLRLGLASGLLPPRGDGSTGPDPRQGRLPASLRDGLRPALTRALVRQIGLVHQRPGDERHGTAMPLGSGHADRGGWTGPGAGMLAAAVHWRGRAAIPTVSDAPGGVAPYAFPLIGFCGSPTRFVVVRGKRCQIGHFVTAFPARPNPDDDFRDPFEHVRPGPTGCHRAGQPQRPGRHRRWAGHGALSAPCSPTIRFDTGPCPPPLSVELLGEFHRTTRSSRTPPGSENVHAMVAAGRLAATIWFRPAAFA
jgi:hypothetical protein